MSKPFIFTCRDPRTHTVYASGHCVQGQSASDALVFRRNVSGADVACRRNQQRTASDLKTAAVCAWVASHASLETSHTAIRCGFRRWLTRWLASLTAFCRLREKRGSAIGRQGHGTGTEGNDRAV